MIITLVEYKSSHLPIHKLNPKKVEETKVAIVYALIGFRVKPLMPDNGREFVNHEDISE